MSRHGSLLWRADRFAACSSPDGPVTRVRGPSNAGKPRSCRVFGRLRERRDQRSSSSLARARCPGFRLLAPEGRSARLAAGAPLPAQIRLFRSSRSRTGWRRPRCERGSAVRWLVQRASGGGQAAEFGQQRFVKLVGECLGGRPVGADEHRAECGFDVVSACSRRLVVSSAASASGGGEGCHQCGEGL